MRKVAALGIAAGLAATMIGVAGPAQADDHDFGFGGRDRHSGYYDRDSNNPWRDQLVPKVKVPHVDTTVHN